MINFKSSVIHTVNMKNLALFEIFHDFVPFSDNFIHLLRFFNDTYISFILSYLQKIGAQWIATTYSDLEISDSNPDMSENLCLSGFFIKENVVERTV